MKKHITLVLVAVLLVMPILSGCDADISNFDITKPNFGLFSPSDMQPESESDLQSPAVSYSDYVVPEASGVSYSGWTAVVSSKYAKETAQPKLLEMAELVMNITATAQTLAQTAKEDESITPESLAADTVYARQLNSIRAWSYGAQNYPAENIPSKQQDVHNALVALGATAQDYAARIPAIACTGDTVRADEYSNALTQQILDIQEMLG